MKMSTSGDQTGDRVPPKRKREHKVETMLFLMFIRQTLPDDRYTDFVKKMANIWKQSADPDGELRENICVEACIQIASELFPKDLLEEFKKFVRGDSDYGSIRNTLLFMKGLKTSPEISDDELKTFCRTLFEFSRNKKTDFVTARDVYDNVKGFIAKSPALLEEFKNYLPEEVFSSSPDVNQSSGGIRVKATDRKNIVSKLEYTDDNHGSREDSFRQTYARIIPDFVQKPTNKEEGKEDEVQPLPDWSKERENELPAKVDLSMCKNCTPSYYRLQNKCKTLQLSYYTKLGRSVINSSLVSGSSGSEEDRFKCITKSHYEEKMLRSEEDMFESDMVLERFKSTADFVKNLQGHTQIKDHLTPLHSRCIENLYDDYGLDMLDALLDSQNDSPALAVLLSRLNQKIEDLTEARLALRKTCARTFADNHHRSLDHRSASFKDSDRKRVSSQKALLAELQEINKTKLSAGDYADPDIHEEISHTISFACVSEERQIIVWTELLQPLLSANCLWPDFKKTVPLKEVCQHCGIDKDSLTSITNSLFAKNSHLLSKDFIDAEIEEGEIRPYAENIKSDAAMLGHGKGPARCEIDGSSGLSSCDHINGSEGQRESTQDPNDAVSSSTCTKTTVKQRSVKGRTCCSLVVLHRLYQIFYERLKVAKDLLAATNKVLSKDAGSNGLYARFKEKLCRLLERSIDNAEFEGFCLQVLGPKSYELFTLDALVNQAIKQVDTISSSSQCNSLLQLLGKSTRPNLSEDLTQQQNARCVGLQSQSPTKNSCGLLKHDQEEDDKRSDRLDDTLKEKSRHFQRRKKHKLENAAASICPSGMKDSNS